MTDQTILAPAPAPRRGFPWLMTCGVLVCGCSCLCIVVLGGGYFFKDRIAQRLPPQLAQILVSPSPTSTYTPTPTPTSTPTPTATRTPTPDLLATRSAEVISLEQASAWPLAVSDTFDSNAGGWAEGRLDDDFLVGTREVVDGVYRWTYGAYRGVTYVGLSGYDASSDFYVSLDARLATGTRSSRYGVVFRYADEDNYYMFDASDDGSVQVYLKEAGTWRTLLSETLVDLSPGKFNSLAVVAHSAAYDIYVNGQLIDTVIDDTLQAGWFGVEITMLNNGDSSVIEFDNFVQRVP